MASVIALPSAAGAIGGVGAVLVWGPVQTAVSAGWTGVADTQAPVWQNVANTQTPNWGKVLS